MRYIDSALDDDVDAALASWLKRELQTAAALTLRTGFYSAGAVEILKGSLEGLLERGGELTAVLGGNVLQIDVAALRMLWEIARRYPTTAHISVVAEPAFQNAKTYHVTQPDGRVSAWVGSPNVTLGGFGTNFEAAIAVTSTDDDPLLLERIRTATSVVAQQAAVELGDDLIEQLRRRVREAQLPFGRASLDSSSLLVSEQGHRLLDELQRVADGDDRLLAITTGFPDLDGLLDGGLRPGTLTVVASAPGAGRSTLVMNVLKHAATTNQVPSCLFTFQHPLSEVLLRVLSADTAIDVSTLRRAQMSDAGWSHAIGRLTKLLGEPLFANSGSAPHLEGLAAAIAAAAVQENVALVAVDPLGAVLARTFADNREREIAEVVRRLKSLAMQFELAIVVTAELGRHADYPDWRPGLNDLRDSGVISHVADHVVLIHNPDALEPRRRATGRASFILAKNSYGRRGSIPVFPYLEKYAFHPLVPPATAAAIQHAVDTLAPATSPAPRREPPTGASGQDQQVADLSGGAKWAVHSSGEGSPTVIYLGRANPADDEWAELTTRLQSLTRIVTYDRPGLAGGDPLTAQVAKGLHRLSTATADLDTLLWQGKVPKPYVLVASSIGCWLADQYAVREPRKVVGMVLIDPVNLTPWPPSEHAEPHPDANDDETGYLRRPQTDSYVDLKVNKPTEPRRTVVVSSSSGRWLRQPPATVTNWDPDFLVELDDRWQGYQRDWVRRTNARHVVAETAGHLVHRDQPDLVAGVVTAVVEASRAGKALALDPTAIASMGGRIVPKAK